MFGWNEAIWFSILTGAAVKSTAVLGVAWIAALALRKHSAAARHLVWTAAFAAILALPILSAALPVLRLPLAGAWLPAGSSAEFETTAHATAGGAAVSLPSRGAENRIHPAAWRPDWRMWLVLLWAAGAASALARTLVGYASAWRVRRSACRFADCGLSGALACTLGIRRAVDVLEIEPGAMPMTFGMRRAVILMPADAAAWSAEKRRVVLLHELAHVRRGDAATQMVGRAALAFYWWNPLAWMAWLEFFQERERAADDLVLQAGARASEYAGHLLDVARTVRSPAAMAWAAAGVARRSQLEDRLRAILDPGVNRTIPSRAAILAGAIFAAAIIAPVAAVRAQEPSSRTISADADVAIRLARSQKNYEALDSAAKEATRLAKYDTAQKLLEAALAIRAGVAGEQSVEYGVGLFKLAELAQKLDPKSGSDLYVRAAQILGERPEAAPALTHLGLAALANRDFVQAFMNFQHARQVDPAHAGTALMWMAVVRQTEQNLDEAERLYQMAITAQDPHSLEAAVSMMVYAQFLRAQGREGQASEFDARVAAAIQRPPAATDPVLPPDVYRVGEGVTAPSVLQKVEPSYSEEARAAKLQGAVVLRVVIGTDGVAHDPLILRGLGLGLDENAIESISQWRFKPGVKDGRPVKVAATIEVNYRLF